MTNRTSRKRMAATCAVAAFMAAVCPTPTGREAELPETAVKPVLNTHAAFRLKNRFGPSKKIRPVFRNTGRR